jgi:betaine-aldehyde dehydrogenase
MVDQMPASLLVPRAISEGQSAGEYMKGMTSFIRREPIGVCAQVTPWNYPMMMAVWKWAPAIAAGNTVVLKPSDTTPMSTVLMANVMSEFLPAGVINVVTGERETGRMLIEHGTPRWFQLPVQFVQAWKSPEVQRNL